MHHQQPMLLIAAMLALAACGSPDPAGPPQRAAISECGGFVRPAVWTPGDLAGYCDAEMLYWSYVAETGSLSLSNTRVILNCCGKHSMRIAGENGTYHVTEVDAPEFGDARCDCMCVFDFNLDASDIPSGTIQLTATRRVTDDEEAPVRAVFDGALDLTPGQGAEVIDTTDLEGWCDPNPSND